MSWNWEEKDWPNFKFNSSRINTMESAFLYEAGLLMGGLRFASEEDSEKLKIDLISNEAWMTSKIEGENLNRESLQSSIRKNFGLKADQQRVQPAEAGISEMMVDLYKTYAEPLTHEMLFNWHTLLMQGRSDVLIGQYRTSEEPMQVISWRGYDPIVHYEAPPAQEIPLHMKVFLQWFNDTAPNGKNPLPALTRASICHLYYESIHPFDDGNGRIGRALAVKAISQTIGYPTLIALSQVILQKKRAYYDSLELNSKHLEITNWLEYFAKRILEAQSYTLELIAFIIEKSKLYLRVRNQLNARQEKALARMFKEGLEGFKGGLTAEKYIKITGAPRSTATLDLKHLVDMGAFRTTGKLKGTRYYLNLKDIGEDLKTTASK